MWDIEHYVTSTGKRPIIEFFSKLNKTTELPFVLHDIELLAELGNEAERPLACLLRDGIYELRTRIIKKQFRILYFFFYDEKIILSHGILKREDRKAMQKSIDLALERKKDYFNHHERRK
jgi:phage-related protein